ncbi:TPA: hypothetical protein N0F65_000214, partial [Lagenidium giganteum]
MDDAAAAAGRSTAGAGAAFATATATAAAADLKRMKSFKKRNAEDDSWTSVDRQELDHATSYVSDSMYLVMENPVSYLYYGEEVQFKAHALCDKSASSLMGAVVAHAEPSHGTLFLTTFRLLFLSFQDAEQLQEFVEVQLCNVAEVSEFRATAKNGLPLSLLEVACKNFEIVKFNFPCEATSADLYVRIQQALISKQPPAAYAFKDGTYGCGIDQGWHVFDTAAEYARLNFKGDPNVASAMTGFRISHANINYKLSPTYPSHFIVPACISDPELRKISHFRARGRVPVVTYRHKNDAVMSRCSQPLVGLRRKRCAADEAFMAALRRESNGKLLFVDCRSQTSAYGNIALGGGFEVLDYYRDANIMFLGIENIHSMRDSIRKLFDQIKNEARGNEKPNWWSGIESTRWLEHMRSILSSAAMCVSKVVDEGTSLVIHCSDGWDRTAQIVALTKLCLDPYYRTIQGFQVLIEQEWCAFGHQFRARSGHGDERSNYWEDDNTSPVFMQFIDAVFQLTCQFVYSFEFNDRFLIALLDEAYGKRSGTFLHDCQESRMGSMTIQRCISAWTLLKKHPQAADFVNPSFTRPVEGDGSTDRSPFVLQYRWHISSLNFWRDFYLRSLNSNDARDAWAKELQVNQRELQEKLSDAHSKLQNQVEQNSELLQQIERLRKEKDQLCLTLEGQVFRDFSKGMLVHEQDDEDGVLLSVTSVARKEETQSSFIEASISPSFEILQSYFDPSATVSTTVECSAASLHNGSRS